MPVVAYRLAKYRREQKVKRVRSESSAFIELAATVAGGERAVAELVYPNGVRLRLFGAIEAESLAALIAESA